MGKKKGKKMLINSYQDKINFVNKNKVNLNLHFQHHCQFPLIQNYSWIS